MTYAAKILADSVSPLGVRLTTLEVTFPRFILAEVNTHRMLCLAGDSELEFDLPAGTKGGIFRRVFRMRLDEFVDKWNNGARRIGANPKVQCDMSWIRLDDEYAADEVAKRLGLYSDSNINKACRNGIIRARKEPGCRKWLIKGQAVIDWRNHVPEHTRFDMRAKLSGMRIRQLNEDTGDIQTATVNGAFFSGRKMTYTVTAGDHSVSGSEDHRVMTADGWKRIGDLSTEDSLIVRKFGKFDYDRMDPKRFTIIHGTYRSQWQFSEKKKLREDSRMCRECGVVEGVDIHHIEPVYVNPSRALDRDNITLLCKNCHDDMHRKQGWQGGTYLYGDKVRVSSIFARGEEDTYDLEISGPYPNFLANGVVVHNSRSSASSRAIPVEKRMRAVLNDPFIPEQFGENRPGMQASEYLSRDGYFSAVAEWRRAMLSAVASAKVMIALGVHKQHANRLLEPFSWHTAIITATEWSNFYALRCHPDAQPEFQRIASMMRDAMTASEPRKLAPGEWHRPFCEDLRLLQAAGFTDDEINMVAIGRCARVSYQTHDGRRDPRADIELAQRLLKSGHMSPFEHVAYANEDDAFVGNFRGWKQYRKHIENEDDFGKMAR